MDIVFSLCLPRDEASVPVVRHIARGAMQKLGIAERCRSDIEIALTEACTNVLKHATGIEDEYIVKIEINDHSCEIRVIDTGTGFDHETINIASDDAESGRGIMLMRALVDDINFRSEPEKGTIVHLVKKLELDPDSVIGRLARAAV